LYNNTFQWDKVNGGEHVFLNLGMVNAIAKVKINGVALGGVWTAPYRIDVTAALKKGKNTVEIKVVNTWVNRLIGDSGLPVAERKTGAIRNPYNAKSKLEASGLLGSVSLEAVNLN
jgi:hypothetical protein